MNTTISITKETREMLRNFGKKSENYDDVIMRMYNTLMLRETLEKFVDETEYSTLEEAEEWTRLKLLESD